MDAEIEKYAFKLVKKLRIRILDVPGAFGRLAVELGKHGAMLGDIIKVHLTSQHVIRDIMMFFDSREQLEETLRDVEKMKGYRVLAVEDGVLNLHRGGKIAVVPTVKVDTLSDLRLVYTPGVAQVCRHILEHPEAVREFTSIGNTVCIATNGTAVLGLGDIGVRAAMPVMEGKSVILHKMAGVSCVPLLVDTTDVNRFTDALEVLSETFSVVMIEDVRAPECFEIEEKLQGRLSVPVFHDDQHGTATVILAALIKILRTLRKEKTTVSIAINGAGAAGIATCRLLLEYGFRNIVVCDRDGAIHRSRKTNMNRYKRRIAKETNPGEEKGPLAEILRGKDVFIGVSSARLVTGEMVRTMNRRPVVLALANPIPEILPKEAVDAGAAFALDGRTVNNCLAFPGIIRGALDARARRITSAMKIRAAETIASLAGKNEGVPNFMNPAVHRKIAAAVRQAALRETGKGGKGRTGPSRPGPDRERTGKRP